LQTRHTGLKGISRADAAEVAFDDVAGGELSTSLSTRYLRNTAGSANSFTSASFKQRPHKGQLTTLLSPFSIEEAKQSRHTSGWCLHFSVTGRVGNCSIVLGKTLQMWQIPPWLPVRGVGLYSDAMRTWSESTLFVFFRSDGMGLGNRMVSGNSVRSGKGRGEAIGTSFTGVKCTSSGSWG